MAVAAPEDQTERGIETTRGIDVWTTLSFPLRTDSEFIDIYPEADDVT
jgi:hypothetical protein